MAGGTRSQAPSPEKQPVLLITLYIASVLALVGYFFYGAETQTGGLHFTWAKIFTFSAMPPLAGLAVGGDRSLRPLSHVPQTRAIP